MRSNRNNGFAIMLIALGALILMGLVGKVIPFIGSLIGLIIPFAMIALGYYGIRRGNAFFGWVVLLFGLLSLMSKLAWLIVPAIGIGLIVYGVSALKGKRGY